MSDTDLTAATELERALVLLREAGRNDLQRDFRKFLAYFLGTSESRLDHSLETPLAPDMGPVLQDGVRALISGVPLSRLIHKRAFWKEEFHITPDVLDPRPDTETLIEAALKVSFDRVLDLGTGSGCILISLLNERREATGVGADISEAALEVARRNAQEAGCGKVASFFLSDWFSEVIGGFDLIVSNPPYIDAETYAGLAPEVKHYDPKIALTPGETGLEAYRAIIPKALKYLTTDGWLMVEIGHDQGASVKQLFTDAGYREVAVHEDINEKDRVVVGKRP